MEITSNGLIVLITDEQIDDLINIYGFELGKRHLMSTRRTLSKIDQTKQTDLLIMALDDAIKAVDEKFKNYEL